MKYLKNKLSFAHKDCIEITSFYDIIVHRYILPAISILLVLWIVLPLFIALLQSPETLDTTAFLYIFASTFFLGYVYHLTNPIVSCKVCKGYLLLKGYGKPIKVDFDNICSIDNADLIKEPGKVKSMVAIRFWKKTALGQKVKIYLKKENIYKGERIDADVYLVKLIKQYSIPK